MTINVLIIYRAHMTNPQIPRPRSHDSINLCGGEAFILIRIKHGIRREFIPCGVYLCTAARVTRLSRRIRRKSSSLNNNQRASAVAADKQGAPAGEVCFTHDGTPSQTAPDVQQFLETRIRRSIALSHVQCQLHVNLYAK